MASYTTPPCPMCGVWECLDCGAKASRRNRYFPGQHHCRTCKGTNGRMLPTHHRDDVHDLHASDVDPKDICHYPLDGSEHTTHPIPGQAACLSGRNAMRTETIEPETEVGSPASTAPTPEVEAAAKALAIHDGWTELGWDTDRIPARFSKRYYQAARVALEAGHPVLLSRVQTQQARLDAVGQLADGFVSKPRNATDAIEQPGFGRGVRAAGRELRAVLDAPEEP